VSNLGDWFDKFLSKLLREKGWKTNMVAAPGLEPGCRSRAADFKSAVSTVPPRGLAQAL
jgi:hypothetical protein